MKAKKKTPVERNPVVVIARARKAGPMRDRRKRREREKVRKEISSWLQS